MLQQLVDVSPQKAREYVNAYGSQMTPQALGQVSKELEISERNQAVNQEVASIMSSGVDEVTALTQAREKFANDPEARKIAITEIKTQYKEFDDMKVQQSKVAFDRAWGLAIDSGKGRRGVDAATWSMLTPQQRDSIEDELYQRTERVRVASDRAEAKREKAIEQRDKRNEDELWGNYYALRKEADTNPEQFKKRDLREVYKDIPNSARKELVDLQLKDPAEIQDVTSLDTQINLTAGSLGIEKEEKYKFETAVRDKIALEQKRRGKPLGEAERQKIVDSMVIEGEVPGGAWYKNDQEGRAYQFYGKPEAAKFVAEGNNKGTKFVEGKIYTDANGNKARYVNGQFVEEK